MGGRESAPGGAQSPRQLSREGSGGRTRNLVGVGVGVAELTQHNPPGQPCPTRRMSWVPVPPSSASWLPYLGTPSPFLASARTSALLGCPCVWVWPLQRNKMVLGKEDPGGWSRGSPGAGPRVPKPPVSHPVTTGVSPPAPRGGSWQRNQPHAHPQSRQTHRRNAPGWCWSVWFFSNFYFKSHN